MTVTLAAGTVADSISGITITGVTIRDFDSLVADWIPIPKVLYPNPERPLTGVSLTRDSQGAGGDAKWTIKYTLNYRYLHVALGNPDIFQAAYSGLISSTLTIASAIITNDNLAGALDITLGGITNIGPLTDPIGNKYYGADIAIAVTELIN